MIEKENLVSLLFACYETSANTGDWSLCDRINDAIADVESQAESGASCDLGLLNAFKSMLMQTPDDIRRDIVSRMRSEHSKIILKWLDEACGAYSYHISKPN